MIPVNLISGYHRDLQYTKEPLMKGIKVCLDVLAVSQIVLGGLTANPENLNKAMTDELLSVRKVMDLVNSGIPFRDAYQQIKRMERG
jgi:argininosuccinate lyase